MAIADSQASELSVQELAPGPPLRDKGRWGGRRWCLIVIALLPALYLFQLIGKYGVDVPYADEFSVAPLLEKAHHHLVTFSDLFEQHNEHRYFFTRLIMIGFAQFAHGNLRAEMFFSGVLAALTAINLWIILRRTVPGSIEKSLVLSFLLNLLLFSPVQAENWLWGFQFVLLFCNFLFTSGVVLATSTLGIWKKFVACLVLAFVATFSFGGGVLLWALTFPFALLTHREMSLKSRIAWGIGWGIAALGASALYFFHYVKPHTHPTLAASHNPVDYFMYITAFAGSHLTRTSRNEFVLEAVIIGIVLLAIGGGALAYAFRYRRNLDLTRRMLPWFALGGYAFLNAALAAVTRIGFGINQALDSRYTSFSLYLSIAAIGLVAIVRNERRSRDPNRRFQTMEARVEAILLTGFAVLSMSAFSSGHGVMMETQRTRLLGKGALLFTNVMDSGEIHERFLIANAPDTKVYANMLDRIGLLHPRMLPSAEISKLNAKNGGDLGYLDYVAGAGSARRAVGWSVLPNTRTPTHCVILSYEDGNRGAIAFRVADEVQIRLDVAAVRHDPSAETSGWVCHFDRSLLPAGALVLRAWAFDANRAILYPLGTPKIIP